MAKPAKSALEKRKELIDAQDHLSEKEKKKLKEEAEKAAEKSAAGDYAQTFEEGFEEYRRLREQGYSKEEATRIFSSKIPLAILSNKADDYIGKNSGIDEVLYSKTHIFVPENNKKFREALNSRNTNDIIITENK